jgi:hypothetical protein
VHPTDYFYEPVTYLYCHGTISGYGDNTFRPYNYTTRGQLAKIVVLAEGWATYTPPTPTFRDVPATDPFYTVIETAYHRGIISGYNCGTGCLEYRPGNNITRAQLCKIVVPGRAEGRPVLWLRGDGLRPRHHLGLNLRNRLPGVSAGQQRYPRADQQDRLSGSHRFAEF